MILESKSEELYHLLNFSESHEKVIVLIYDEIMNNMNFLTVVIIVLTIALMGVEYAYLKNYFIRRKII